MTKNTKRMGAAVMAALLAIQGMGTMSSAFAAEQLLKVKSDSQMQMSSEPETVYVNAYHDTTERSQNFDANWKFYLGEAGAAQNPEFDDSKWRQVSLPHDYSIEQEYSQSMEAESGYLAGGTGWYRKNFIVGEEWKGKRVRIDFDGVYMNSTVWVNGHKLGTHPYGYTPFSYDITDYVKFGEENIIAVKVDHKTPSSRWYSGSGIYRSVNLTVTDNVHVDLYGTKIETNNLESQQNGTVDMSVKTTVANDSDSDKKVTLTHTIFQKGADESAAIGTVVTEEQSVKAGAKAEIAAVLPADKPELWSPENPALYTVRTEVKTGDKVTDTYDTEYGFRYFAFDKNTGFSLNGEKTKLKGVCMHHDQGALGAVANRRAMERQVEILKEMGCNSIRVTHNPASQALIEICNEQGILVIDEFFDGWQYSKNGNINDYAKWFNAKIEEDNTILGKQDDMTWSEFDLKATVRRAQNAPSIIMWSLGNEIQEGAGGTGYDVKSKDLIRWTEEVDTERLITIGSNAVKKTDGGEREHITIAENITKSGGVSGTNYSKGESYDELHRKYPNWNLYGSETASSVNSRGIYKYTEKQLTSYDTSAVSWGAYASSAWYDVIKRDFVAGEYVWTGFDYIGEPTPWNGTSSGAQGSWESPKNSYFGIVDTAGFPKDSYYFYQSQWNEEVNTLHILPAWNSDVVTKDGNNQVKVVVYSDAAAVELFLNDRSLGKKEYETITTDAGYQYQKVKQSSDSHENLYMTWNVPYEDGILRAVAYDKDGTVIKETEGRSVIHTTGEEAKLSASADRDEILADGKDLTYITVDVTDKDGNIVPNAANRVKFHVEGEGVLVGVDNGSSPDHDSYKLNHRKAFSGKVLAIVQSTKNAGDITVTASADGLDSSVVKISTKEVENEEAERQADSFFMAKTYYVKMGNMPKLPESLEVRYTDGTAEKVNVNWEEISEDEISKAGNYFVVKGETENGFVVSVNVNVIDEIGGLLNYSTAAPVGVRPILPESRQAVMADGTIMNTAFAVQWDDVEDDAFDSEGIVTIEGTANVFGEELKVTASVRVQKEQMTIGNSVSAAGKLSQDIPEDMQSDTLEAIKDGATAIDANTGGGPNPSAWSNWKSSQEGNDKAEITFAYDTQQRLGQIVIHFAEDSASMRFPDKGTTEIWLSEDGEKWTKLEAAETIGTAANRVKPYTYDFAPVTATFVKFKLTNAASLTKARPCTAITEIELKEAKGRFVTNTTANLARLTVNGVDLPESVLAAGSYSTPALFAEVQAAAADNAAVTVLPAYEDKIRIIVESEDHNTTNEFVIYLNQEETEAPDDASRDYPTEKCAAIADSIYPGAGNEGAASHVLDGSADTYWHTNWNTNEATDVEKRWIGLSLDEAVLLDGLRYLPRQVGANGRVTEYKVQYRASESDAWTDIAAGTWEKDDASWQRVKFDEPVIAKQVRLVGVHTFADSGNDAHMSATELRVTAAKNRIDISDEENAVTVDVPQSVEAAVVDEENPVMPSVVVKDGEKELRYGVDYLLSYENNTSYGTASVTVSGIGQYTGSVTKEFEIVRAEEEKELTGIFVSEQPAKTIYTEGETFEPEGLVLELVYSDDTTEKVAYGEDNQSDFTFSPSLDSALKTEDKKVEVSYAGKTTAIDITVGEKQAPVLESVQIKTLPDKTSYETGEKFNPKGLVLTLVYSDGTKEDVAYGEETKADFAFDLGLEDALTEKTQSVTVTYKEKTVKFEIEVRPLDSVEEARESLKAAVSQKKEEIRTFDFSGFSEESVEAYYAAFAEIEEVSKNPSATLEQIHAAMEKLNTLENILVKDDQTGGEDEADDKKPEPERKQKIQKYYDECQSFYKQENHSETNWKAYVRAMKELKAALDSEDTTKDELETKYNALLKVTEKMNQELEADKEEDKGDKGDKGDKDQTDNSTNGTSQNPPKAPDKVQTGDSASAVPMAAGLLAAAATIAAVIFRRKIK